ncbi:hypothetical protein ACC721_37420, partial [Rhizobium ruizarguesonis]
LNATLNPTGARLNPDASWCAWVSGGCFADRRLGGQANVRGVAGTWKDLTENVNSMAYNLTAQVRNIADVATERKNGERG